MFSMIILTVAVLAMVRMAERWAMAADDRRGEELAVMLSK